MLTPSSSFLPLVCSFCFPLLLGVVCSSDCCSSCSCCSRTRFFAAPPRLRSVSARPSHHSTHLPPITVLLATLPPLAPHPPPIITPPRAPPRLLVFSCPASTSQAGPSQPANPTIHLKAVPPPAPANHQPQHARDTFPSHPPSLHLHRMGPA